MDEEMLLPEDLTALSADELAELTERINSDVTELGERADADELTEEDETRINQVADARDALEAETSRRDDAAAEAKARIDTALGRLRPAAEVEEPPPPGDDEEQEEEETETDLTPVPAQAAATVKLPATAKRRPPSALAAARPKAAAPKPARSGSFMKATRAAATVPGPGYNVNEGDDYEGPSNVAKAIAKAHHAMAGHVPEGTFERISLGSGRKELDGQMLSQDPVENFAAIRDLRCSYKESQDTLVASGGGGYCAPYTPMYDFYRLAEAQSPLEDDLPVIQAPRGGIRYMAPMDWRVGAAAPGTQTKAQNTAGTVKSVLALTCPTIREAEVLAVYQIVKFDNLQYRTFPEQVEAFLEDVAVGFAATKESYYLAQLVANSTSVSACTATGVSGYGASRSLFWDWVTAAVEYRKRNGMKRDSTIKVYAPDWTLDIIKLDMAMDAYESFEFMGVTDAQVTANLRAHNLDVVFYNDMSTGNNGSGAPDIAHAQAAGNLNDWPQRVISILASPGSFARLDGGSLDLGIVRDSTLNGTNDLEMFMEEWIGFAFLGVESIRLVSCVCPNGAGPAAVTAMSCA